MPELYENAAAAARSIDLTDVLVGFDPGDGTDRAVATDTLAEIIARIFQNPPAVLTPAQQATLRDLIGVDTGSGPGQQELIYYGIIGSAAEAANVDVATLTSEDASVAGHDVTMGPSTQGDVFVFLTPSQHRIITLVNRSVNVNVLPTYTLANDVRMLGNPAEQYRAYTLGPLNPGLTVNYRLTLME